MISFYTTTSAAYAALTPKNNESLYFLTDTHQVYRGAVLYTGSIQLVTAFPSKGAEGTLYIISSTLEGRIWEANAWKVAVKGYTEKITSTSLDLPTSKAVTEYIATAISTAIESAPHVKDVTYSNVDNERILTIVKGDETTKKISLTDLITTVAYDATNLTLTFGVSGLNPIVVNLPKDNFITGGSYNAENKEIEITMKDKSVIRIPAADLVDVYTGAESTTASVTVSDTNVITASVKISATSGNIVSAKTDGIYAAATDISGKTDKLEVGTADEVLFSLASGGIKRSGKTVGGATIAVTPSANILATELAVNAIREALQGSINTVRNGLDTKLDIANVAQTINAATPSTSKVISEAGIVSALSWKTI